ncbi:hypothetical protein TWF506_008004 [Arthrobotrys conoides]|uniref:Uncharacterized protein n=1 Tax=Arthrobotrys conoides TaxID=74498 RepID=A0AAN8NKU8_9PEZI
MEAAAEELGEYRVVKDDVQFVQKLNPLPNRRNFTKQEKDLTDLQFLLSSKLCLRSPVADLRKGYPRVFYEQIDEGKVILQLKNEPFKYFIEGLSSKALR